MRWTGIHKFNVLEALEYRGLLLEPMGKKFYVNGNTGSDGYSGESQKNPMKTILAALAKCVDYHNDYIIVLDHYQETFPISVDKASVHIIAMGPYNVGQPMVYLAAATTPVFNIAADYVEIAGFEFGSGASNGAIEWTASKGYGLIRDCVFGRMQTGQDGINVPATFDAVQMTIRNCLFSAGLTRDGIRIDHNMTRGIIEDCYFRAVSGVGINVPGQMAQGIIRRNKFMLTGNTAGQAITFAAAVAGVFVEDNDANYGKTAMAQIPWVHTGGASAANTWDNNKKGGVVVFPA